MIIIIVRRSLTSPSNVRSYVQPQNRAQVILRALNSATVQVAPPHLNYAAVKAIIRSLASHSRAKAIITEQPPKPSLSPTPTKIQSAIHLSQTVEATKGKR